MTKVVITDHALIRWLERARGFDLEIFRDALAEIAQPYADIRVKQAEIGGLWFIFHEDRLVTVTPEKPRRAQMLRHDREYSNGTDAPRERASWQMKKRRKAHK